MRKPMTSAETRQRILARGGEEWIDGRSNVRRQRAAGVPLREQPAQTMSVCDIDWTLLRVAPSTSCNRPGVGSTTG